MDGFPETAEQAKALQAIGIMPKHVIVLEAPDSLLLERAEGKRIDPETKGNKLTSAKISHANFAIRYRINRAEPSIGRTSIVGWVYGYTTSEPDAMVLTDNSN